MRAPLAHASGDSLELVQQQHFVGGGVPVLHFGIVGRRVCKSPAVFRTCALATGAVRLFSAGSGRCSVTRILQPLPYPRFKVRSPFLLLQTCCICQLSYFNTTQICIPRLTTAAHFTGCQHDCVNRPVLNLRLRGTTAQRRDNC